MKDHIPRGHGGQAAVETVALTALVALLLAVVAAWLLHALPGGVSPPPLVERAARALAPAPPRVSAPPRADGGVPVWRRLLRGGRAALLFRNEIQAAFGRGVAGRLRERGGALLRDPLSILPRPGLGPPDPVGARRAAGGRLSRARQYAALLRRMSRRDAILRASEDLGALVTDKGLDLLTRRALRRAVDAGRRAPRRPGGPAARPSARRP